jgi:hypothetical protein
MTTRTYDIIVFGDEIPGILALVSAAREYHRRLGRYPRSLLMTPSDTSSTGKIGGHLVRGRLSYLDRSSVTPALRQQHGLDTFGAPAAIYLELLKRSGTIAIALDPDKANLALRGMLREVRADILDRATIAQVTVANERITAIALQRGETYQAQQFIDATTNAQLVKKAGVRKLSGFATLGLSNSALPVSYIFETRGLTPTRLRQIEDGYLKRLLDPGDAAAQRYLNLAAGGDPAWANFLRGRLRDANGNPAKFYQAKDSIDVRCPALSIFYHASRGTTFWLEKSPIILDQGNIAVLPGDRLSWNALLGRVTAQEAEAIANQQGKPPANLVAEAKLVTRWLQTIGGSGVSVVWGTEVYNRFTGSVVDVVQPLSGGQMMAGGVPAAEAIGTFGYHLDVRGGIIGLGDVAKAHGFPTMGFLSEQPPVFNYGIRHAQVKALRNLAILGPGSGFTGMGPGAGRIVELNVGVGQGIGIAAAIALHEGRGLGEITNQQVRSVLQSTGKLTKIFGTGQSLTRQVVDFETKLLPPDILNDSPIVKPTPNPTFYPDMQGHWAASFLQALVDRKVLTGFEDGSMRPDDQLTRAQFAAMLVHAYAAPEVQSAKRFWDVPGNFWGADVIAQASARGFMTGFPDGSFRPNQALRRAEAITAIANVLTHPLPPDLELLSYYRDRDRIPSYATNAVAIATAQSVIVNYPDRDLLNPQRVISRGEVAAMVYQGLVARGEAAAIASDYIVHPLVS